MILKHRDREILRFEWLEPYGVHIVSVKRRLGKLQQEGRIKRVGSDKTGHWEVL